MKEQVSKWVATQIVKASKTKQRVHLIKKFIEVAHVRQYHPLSSLFALLLWYLLMMASGVVTVLSEIEQLQHVYGHSLGRPRQCLCLSVKGYMEGEYLVP